MEGQRDITMIYRKKEAKGIRRAKNKSIEDALILVTGRGGPEEYRESYERRVFPAWGTGIRPRDLWHMALCVIEIYGRGK
ncbi:hypothetical protein Tco_1136600 [Tanacetum coccineum]